MNVGLALFATFVILALACAPLGARKDCVSVFESADPKKRGFIVEYKTGIDPVSTTARFAKKYSFTPRFVWTLALNGFAADLSPKVLAGIRCEPEVRRIEPDTAQNVLARASFGPRLAGDK
jgi:hypothetical protein